RTWGEGGRKGFRGRQWRVVACANAGARLDARIAAMPPVFAASAPPPESLRKLRRLTRAMEVLPLMSLPDTDRLLGLSNPSRSPRGLPGPKDRAAGVVRGYRAMEASPTWRRRF